MKIIFGAVVSVQPFAPGFVWNWMHFADGFRRLGHDVYYVEEVGPKWCIDAQGRPCDLQSSRNREIFQSCMDRFGLMEHACQVYNGGETTFGLSQREFIDTAKDADVLINMSGHIKSDFILSSAKRRVYVDQDPVYTQLWHAEYGKDIDLKVHDVFFSVGLNIGTSNTPIPDCGLKWHGLLPPVVLDFWPMEIDPACERFTTIASWAGYKDLCFRGEWYGGKSHEFRRFANLPAKSGQACEVAMRRHREDGEGVRLLCDGGWLLNDATEMRDLSTYQRYIAGARAEIGIAKGAYVKGRSGWFSDRAAQFLASGKPVLAQATGFEDHVPTGRGLLSFNDMDQAVAGIHEINRDYVGHCRAAREFAAEYLDYRKVLPSVLEIACSSRSQEVSA